MLISKNKNTAVFIISIIISIIMLITLVNCTSREEENQTYSIAFLQHLGFMAFSTDPYDSQGIQWPRIVRLMLVTNLSSINEEMHKVRLVSEYTEWEVDRVQIDIFTPMDPDDDLEMFQMLLFLSDKEPGEYFFNQIAFSIGENEHIANIGDIEIIVFDGDETTWDIFIGKNTLLTTMNRNSFELHSLTSDVIIKGIDGGAINNLITHTLSSHGSISFDFSDNMSLMKDETIAIHVFFDEAEAPLAITIQPWVIYEYNGQERRIPSSEVSLILIDILNEDTINNLMESDLVVSIPK